MFTHSIISNLRAVYQYSAEYSGYGAKFDSAISWSFHNKAARNVIIFGSSSHSDNSKDNFFSAR